jgi:polyhydroxyalkanoate synthesis repressor PhaR
MSQTPPKVVIKKYENRRLYDSTHSRYVNLEEVARLIRDGADVQVIDAKTQEDRTRTVLSQIILEGGNDRELSLPLELLRQLVRASDSAGRKFLEWYLHNAMDAYQKVSQSLLGAPPKPDPAREIETLHRRLEELEKRLAATERPKRTSRKAAKKA